MIMRPTGTHPNRAGAAFTKRASPGMKSRALLTLCLMVLSPLSMDVARAQVGSVQRELKVSPGRDVRAGVFTDIRPDCTAGPLPAIRLASAPAHGTVTVKRAVLKITNFKQCLAAEAPAVVAIYRAAQDFSGSDTFDLEISFPGGRKQVQHFHVSLGNDSSAGQGI
jgi:hypothetical protein